MDSLMMIKVTSNLPQSKLEGMLLSFVNSNRNILVLVANMDDLTKSMISDLRIMVEEVERRFVNYKKLFVLLLHFSPVQLFYACYSSLFLQGWDHRYLDSISSQSLTREGKVQVMVEVQYWYKQCCIPIEPSTSDPTQQLKPVLMFLLREAIPVLCSRVTGFSRSITEQNDASSKSKLLKEFLFNSLMEQSSIGELMCMRFSSYWTNKVIAECMQEVVTATYNEESTLNIKESIQTVFQSLFIDFLVYMISNIFFSRTCEEGPICWQALLTLFWGILKAVSLPELGELRVLSSSQKFGKRHRFPFFEEMCKAMDVMLEDTKDMLNLMYAPSLSETVGINQEATLFTTVVEILTMVNSNMHFFRDHSSNLHVGSKK